MDDGKRVLSPYEVNEALEEHVGWSYQDGKFSKQFLFDNFADAVNFLAQIAPFCDEIGHHPDAHLYYNKIVFDLTTHSAGNKVTPMDLAVLNEIERLYIE